MKKLNYQMLILQTIGIILVVVGHVGGIGLFSDWFPISSFHMPLFVFISGYFYKKEYDNCVGKFILKKAKRLLIPYFMWNMFYGIIMNIANLKLHMNVWVGKLDFEFLFLEPWRTGHQFSINVAAWFVLSLFLVEVVTVLFRKAISYIKLDNEYIIFCAILIAGLIGVFYANRGYNTGWYLTLVRMLFLLPFYQLGFLYKSKLENNDKLNNLSYFSALFFIQFILFRVYKELDISVVFCQFNKNSIIQPYLSALTGILFWLRVSKILVPSLDKSNLIRSIGKNTWSIMMHHQFVFFVINCIIYKTYSIFNLKGFEIEKFKSSIWYTYSSGDFRSNIFYVFAGIMIPVLIVMFFDLTKRKVLEYDKIKKITSKY